MSTELPFRLKPALRPGEVILWMLGGVLVSAALQYLWLFQGRPFAFRVWGFSVLPAMLAPLPFLFVLFDTDLTSTAAIRTLFGRLSHWALTCVILLTIFCGAVWVHNVSGGSIDPDWRWISLAMSAVLDLPLLLVWTLPMLFVQELFWRTTVHQAFASKPEAARHMLSGLLWTAGQGVFLWQLFLRFKPLFAASVCVLVFAIGFFASSAQKRGALLLSGFAVLASVSFAILLFGNGIPEINHILFGYDVESMDGLFSASLPGREGYVFGVSAALFAASFLLLFRNKAS